MSDEPIDPELDSLLDLLAEEERGEPDPVEHPSAATLSAYHARTLPADQADQVREHLVACRQCRDQLLDYAQLMDSPSEDPADNVSSLERAAEWRRLKERMKEDEAGTPAPLPGVATKDRMRLRRSLRMFQALAAGLGALAIGLFLHNVYLQDRARILPEQLLSFDTTRSAGGSKRPQVRVPAALRIQPDADYPKYRVEIETTSGKRMDTLELTIGPDGVLIELPGRWAPGVYKVRLLGLKDGQVKPVGKPQELTIVR